MFCSSTHDQASFCRWWISGKFKVDFFGSPWRHVLKSQTVKIIPPDSGVLLIPGHFIPHVLGIANADVHLFRHQILRTCWVELFLSDHSDFGTSGGRCFLSFYWIKTWHWLSLIKKIIENLVDGTNLEKGKWMKMMENDLQLKWHHGMQLNS